MAPKMSVENKSDIADDSDDDFDWEEVAVPQIDSHNLIAEDVQDGPSTQHNIEITIQTHPKKDDSPSKKRAAELAAERIVRLQCHKIHTIGLLINAKIRNKWINDPLLHARLMSITPLLLQNAFAVIHKSRVPDAAQRGHMFENAVSRLTHWWCSTFAIESSGHIRNRTFNEVQALLVSGAIAMTQEGCLEDPDEGEVIHDAKSLMKHALMRRGSRDVSAQLFTALCRAFDIPARLVVSLQSVPWQASVGKPKPTGKRKGRAAADEKGKGRAIESDEDDDMEEVDIPSSPVRANGKGKEKATSIPGEGRPLDGENGATDTSRSGAKQKAPPVIRLRKSKGLKLGSAPPPPKGTRTPDPTTTAPVFWTEVFSRADAQWIPVDPVRNIINKRKAFDPTAPNNASRSDRNAKVENRMVYVVALEEDGFGRDVTRRYAREYGAKVSKVQQGGKGRRDWWEMILGGLITRPYRLHRDDMEDEELQTMQITEAMPSSMAGFKDHPLYVLERHLKREEVIYPLVELGKFRGEPVYPRSNVISLKAAENWMRQGRKVVEGCQPMKFVKQRAATINKQRAIEFALADQREHPGLNEGEGFASEDGAMQGLYAENQTELYRPDPVVNGKVPKNDFGNIDLYVPSMLPTGAVHVPYKGTAKAARQLGIDYAEAVTGFEFKKRRAFPVVTGIVIAAEHESALLEAFWEAERVADETRRAKRQEQVIKRWQRLVHGLRIRQRLQKQYADRGQQDEHEIANIDDVVEDAHQPGGFLTGADAVVQPFLLPRNAHDVSRIVSAFSSNAGSAEAALAGANSVDAENGVGHFEFEVIEDDVVAPREEGLPLARRSDGVPMTMQQLAEAEDAEQKGADERSVSDDDAEFQPASPAPTMGASKPNGNGRATRAGVRGKSAGTSTPSTPSRNAVSAAKAKSRPAPRASATRKRGRGKTQSSEDDNADVQLSSSKAPPAKRARRTAAVPAPRSDRVLRNRISKSASQLAEEHAVEAAFEAATAE